MKYGFEAKGMQPQVEQVDDHDNWIPATQRLPGANQKVRMKWSDTETPSTEWVGDILIELADVKPESRHKLLWLDMFSQSDTQDKLWDEIQGEFWDDLKSPSAKKLFDTMMDKYTIKRKE